MAKQRFGAQFNPFQTLTARDWYFSDGFAQEINVTWGSLRRFAIDIYGMKFARAQTCWLDSSLDGIQDRRQAALAMARGVINERDLPAGEIDRMWPMIGVETCSPRLANSICQAYITPPVRTFSKEEPIDSGFTELYESLGINETMNEAYRAALFTNTVLIWWDGETFVALTPDEFRIEYGRDGMEVWLCRREGETGKVIRFDVWTEGGVVTHDNEGRVVSIDENKFGRIPGVVLKLEQSIDTYGGGIVEAAEINAWGNLIRLFSTRVALYQGFSITLGINLAGVKEGTRIGPGSMLQVNNPTGEAGAMPDLKVISQDGKFQELEQFRRLAINSFERNQGLPGYLVDEGAGTPPTGAALQVMERALNDRRRQHGIPLKRAERDMCDLLSCVIQKEERFVNRRTLVPDSFSVQFAEPQTFDDPQKSLAYDITKAQSGAFTPMAFAEKYLGIKFKTDDEAIAALVKNKSAFSFLAPPVPSAPTA